MIANHDMSAWPRLMSLFDREAGENYLDATTTLQYFTLLAEKGPLHLLSGSCIPRRYPNINKDFPNSVFGPRRTHALERNVYSDFKRGTRRGGGRQPHLTFAWRLY